MSFRRKQVLFLARYQVHNPAPSDMLSWVAAVGKNIAVDATCFFKGIGKDREMVESSVIVNGLGQFPDCAVLPVEPGGVERDGAKRVAEDITEEACILCVSPLKVIQHSLYVVHQIIGQTHPPRRKLQVDLIFG